MRIRLRQTLVTATVLVIGALPLLWFRSLETRDRVMLIRTQADALSGRGWMWELWSSGGVIGIRAVWNDDFVPDLKDEPTRPWQLSWQTEPVAGAMSWYRVSIFDDDNALNRGQRWIGVSHWFVAMGLGVVLLFMHRRKRNALNSAAVEKPSA